MTPTFAYFKELPLDDENKFTLNLMENNNIGNATFLKNKKYLPVGLKINLKIEDDLTKWPECKRIKNFSDLIINETKKKDPENFQFKIKISIDNIIGWNEKYLFMEEKIEEKNYYYLDTDTKKKKKNAKTLFQKTQKLFSENLLKAKNENFEFLVKEIAATKH